MYDYDEMGIDDPNMELLEDGSYQMVEDFSEMKTGQPTQYTHDPSVTIDMTKESGVQRKMGVVNDLMDLAESASTGQADIMLAAVESFSKSQMTRFFDVSVIGPLLLYYAYKGKLNPIERSILGLIGLGTVIYNGRNFLKNRNVLSSPAVVAIKDELKERL